MIKDDKRILFLSALDFKEKSIQVIRITPEAYRDNGWDVTYVVARDNSKNGNYFYEKEINPKGIEIFRFNWPFEWLRGKVRGISLTVLNKIAGLVVVGRLFLEGRSRLLKQDFNVIYGYETHGALAMALLKFFGYTKASKTVSRFQGSFLYEMMRKRQYVRLFFNLDRIVAIRFRSDLLIMTDDGTQGDKAVTKIKKGQKYNFEFLVNGVDYQLINEISLKSNKFSSEIIQFVSVSRLVSWKKVERCIHLFNEIQKETSNTCSYRIIGDGDQRPNLERMVIDLDLSDNVTFVGAVPHLKAMSEINNAHFLLSMYDSSNVGNPLIEALALGTPVATLNTGDTGAWIKHMKNGLIWNLKDLDYQQSAKEIVSLADNREKYSNFIKNVTPPEIKRLMDWGDRMSYEIDKVVEKI